MSWPWIALGNLVERADIPYGIVQPGHHEREGVPIVRVKDLTNGSISQSDPLRVTPAISRKHQRTVLKGGELLLSIVGSVGEAAVAPASLAGWNVARAIAVVRPTEVTADWVRYCLQIPSVRDSITSMLNTTVQATLNLSDLKRLEIPVPPCSARQAIAEVLGALDDKIVANNRLVVTAEDLMQTIAASSADMTTVSQVAMQVTGQIQPEAFATEVAHYSLPAFDEQARPELTTGGAIKSNKFTFNVPVVLMSKLNPRIPRLWNVPVLPSRMALASTEFVVLAPNGVGASELWSALRQTDVWTVLTGKVAGTSGSHQRVKPSEIMSLSIPDPRSLPTRDRASLGTLGLRCQAARDEAVRLAAMRDALLPALMSGKIRVKDTERVVGEAV